MIKRIIFDLDNTLIMWKDEYLSAIKKIVTKYNMSVDGAYVNNLVDQYDSVCLRYDKSDMLEFINKNLDEKITKEIFDDYMYELGFCAEYDYNVEQTLKYLSHKYELVILTNFFTDVQVNRLKEAGYYKYFKGVYGAEKSRKPFKESFLEACGDNETCECLMVGDNYEFDVKGAIDAGLNSIYFNNKNKNNNILNIKEISDIRKLEEML